MKPIAILLTSGLLAGLLCGLSAQVSPASQPEDQVLQPVIPKEVAQPPYEVGDLVTEQGYYVERGEGLPRINLRIVGNKFHLYWIDEDGLIAEPEYAQAAVRITSSVRGRNFHYLKKMPSGAGLSADSFAIPPFLYNLILPLIPEEDSSAEPVVHAFRYTPELNQERIPLTGEPE
jgi:hypothetical protein